MSLELELDDDGYPTEATLQSIAKAEPQPDEDTHKWALQLLRDVLAIWWGGKKMSLEEQPFEDRLGEPGVVTVYMSTGGWSGNADLIRALQENFYFWQTAWRCSERGGHYEFEFQVGEADES